jgi:hypothetical protein
LNWREIENCRLLAEGITICLPAPPMNNWYNYEKQLLHFIIIYYPTTYIIISMQHKIL